MTQDEATALTDRECMDLVLGALRICAAEKSLSHRSTVDTRYSHLYPDGERMMLRTINLIFPKIIANELARVETAMHAHLLKELK